MTIRTLNTRLIIKDALKEFGNRPRLVPITKGLSLAHIAYRSYEYLDEERKNTEQKSKKTQEAGEKRLEMLLERQEAIQNLKTKLKCIQDEIMVQTTVSDELLYETNKRLNKGLDKNNFT